MKIGRMGVGVDTAKRVFQLHWVETETGECLTSRHLGCYSARRFDAGRRANRLKSLDPEGQISAPNNTRHGGGHDRRRGKGQDPGRDRGFRHRSRHRPLDGGLRRGVHGPPWRYSNTMRDSCTRYLNSGERGYPFRQLSTTRDGPDGRR